MNVTTEQIENELIDFFCPFVFIAVREEMTEGGFDIRNINGTRLRFIIFDKTWEDENKQKIWEETYDVRDFYSLVEIKMKLAPLIEKSIRTFCGC